MTERESIFSILCCSPHSKRNITISFLLLLANTQTTNASKEQTNSTQYLRKTNNKRMHLRKCFVDVSSRNHSSADANPKRRLLALIATLQEQQEHEQQEFAEVLVYFHGFPDMAVHPNKLDFASRMPYKLSEAWLAAAKGEKQCAFVTFNFGGVPGSDQELRFTDKTISQEVDDAIAVCAFVKHELRAARVHVVGLSTGAIIASLLRGRQQEDVGVDTIAVIAGLLDLQRGIDYDFSPLQRMQFENEGACWKEFYLPEGSAALPANVEVSIDGETGVDIRSNREAIPSKIFLRLDKQYITECQDGTLDIANAVAASSSSTQLPPFLVIHGDADQNVPFQDGQALFAAASEPKTFLQIPKANHLLSNSKHLKKALHAIVDHTAAVSTKV